MTRSTRLLLQKTPETDNMKIMTLNTHSLAEPDYESKLTAFAGSLVQIQPDIIALQEVSQSRNASPAAPDRLPDWGYVPCSTGDIAQDSPSGPRTVIRADNHAFNLALLLAQSGLSYEWTWVPAKIGYGKYDEGLAVLSRSPILGTHQFYITGSRDYGNWKTRKILGISTRTEHGTEYFYSVHMGWWNDSEEPFEGQWTRICSGLAPLSGEQVWLMGDFNSPAHVAGQGHDLVLASGWFDSYDLAASKDGGITVEHAIDGWREHGEISGMRIDYIWTSRRVPVISSRTIFNGASYPIVSDHFGIITEY